MSGAQPRARLASLSLLCIALTLLALPGCDKATPTAPKGAVITLRAPAEIGNNASASVVAVVFRESLPAAGVDVTFGTTLGRFEPTVATTDSSGEARSTLHTDGAIGTAKITASSGAATAGTADVKLGNKVLDMSLTANPLTVSENADASVNLTATVRDERGEAFANAPVIFATTIGRLDSNGAIRRTNANGQATDRLRVTSGELTTISTGTFQVRAESASAGGGTAEASATITIRQRPRASFTFARTGLTVVFTDTSTGDPREWRWSFGDGNTSDVQNPAHTYAAEGTYIVTLEVENELGEDSASAAVTVSPD
jgi:PKD repeat protein